MATKIKHNEPKADVNKVKKGHLMVFVYYAQVKETLVQNNDVHLLVTDLDSGMEFEVHCSSLIQKSFSADQFAREEEVTKTMLAEILIKSYNVPLTVVFQKVDGSDRTLRGRLLRTEPLLGRSPMQKTSIFP
jgi:hypothetical protein